MSKKEFVLPVGFIPYRIISTETKKGSQRSKKTRRYLLKDSIPTFAKSRGRALSAFKNRLSEIIENKKRKKGLLSSLERVEVLIKRKHIKEKVAPNARESRASKRMPRFEISPKFGSSRSR